MPTLLLRGHFLINRGLELMWQTRRGAIITWSVAFTIHMTRSMVMRNMALLPNSLLEEGRPPLVVGNDS